MKKFILPFFMLCFINCDFVTNKSSSKSSSSLNESKQSGPTTFDGEYDIWLNILESLKYDDSLNPEGYVIYGKESLSDEFGNTKTFTVQEYPLIKVSKAFYDEVNKFSDVHLIWKVDGIDPKFSKSNYPTAYKLQSVILKNWNRPYLENWSQSRIKSTTWYWDLP